MCDFCENAIFSMYKPVIEHYEDFTYAGIAIAGGNCAFPINHQFKYCPVCGRQLRCDHTFLTNFPKSRVDVFRIAIDEYGKKYVGGNLDVNLFEIKEFAYDSNGEKLEGCYSLHYNGSKRDYTGFTNFWKIVNEVNLAYQDKQEGKNVKGEKENHQQA